MKTETFYCDLNSPEHVFRFVVSECEFDNQDIELYLEVYLNQYRSFFQRLMVAIKYLFGYKSKYGHWDVTTLSEDDVQRLFVFIHQHRTKLLKLKRRNEQ